MSNQDAPNIADPNAAILYAQNIANANVANEQNEENDSISPNHGRNANIPGGKTRKCKQTYAGLHLWFKD